MKKMIALMLALMLVLSLAACGDSAPAAQPAPGANVGTTAPAGTAAGTEATTTATEPAPTETTPVTTEEPTEPVATEPVATEPVADETYFVKTGVPALGTVIDNSYVNEAAGLTCTMPEGFAFANDEQLLQFNEVTSVEDLMKKNDVVVAYASNGVDSAMIVGAFKLGTDVVGGNQDAGDAILHIVEEDMASLEGDGATITDPQLITVTFTAGKARGTLMTAAVNGQEVTFLHVGYQFGDYVVMLSIQAPTEAAVEEIFLGVDVE